MINVSTSRVGSHKQGTAMKSSTVTVNGTVYDARTGKPLRRERGLEPASKHAAQSVHAQPQRSRTLSRRYVKRDDIVKQQTILTTQPRREAPPAISIHKRPVAPAQDVRHKGVTKFVKPSAQAHHVVRHPQVADVAPTPHAIAIAADQRVKAFQAQQNPQPAAVRPSQVIKQESIQNAIASSAPKGHKKEVRQKKQQSKAGRFMSVASASLAILLLGGYFTYLNMPSLSTRVAASQAGIDASYPSYQPSGYSLSGPVAYQQGSVTMSFAANAGPQSYVLTQQDSDWDSSAVLENAVRPQAGSNYTTTATSGLTIYNFGGKSVWVNNGILYSISGTANLSGEQIQRIATSL